MSDKRRALEQLLGVALPAEAGGLRFVHARPNPDLAAYVAFAGVELPRERALAFMRELGLGDSPEAGFHLVSGWNVHPEYRPAWFPAVRGGEAGARDWGVNGWLIGAYEDGTLWLLATDTGAAGGTPGPW
jgi:hypothetical protein